MLEAQEERGEDYAFNRDRYEGDDKP